MLALRRYFGRLALAVVIMIASVLFFANLNAGLGGGLMPLSLC